ncbi:MAG: hypothetical protein ACOC83_00205 [Gemmatimonadota bacterium]
MIAIYLFGALLVVLLVGVTLAPLLEQERSDAPIEDLPAPERRELALEALRELEFEHETGKLGDDEFRRQRARYGRLALEALEELETAGADGSGAADEVGPDPESGDAASRSGEPELRCPSCSAVRPAGARYCARCGSQLEAGAAGSS